MKATVGEEGEMEWAARVDLPVCYQPRGRMVLLDLRRSTVMSMQGLRRLMRQTHSCFLACSGLALASVAGPAGMQGDVMNSEELERDSGPLRAASPPHMRTATTTTKKNSGTPHRLNESTLEKLHVEAEDGALRCDYDCQPTLA